MASPVLLLAAGAALLLLISKDKGKGGKRPGEEFILSEEMEFMTRMPDGRLHYKDHPLVGMALLTKEIKQSPHPGIFQLIQHDPINGDNVPPSFVDNTQVANAYEGAKDLHSRGFDIYVTPTLFHGLNAKVPRELYASPQGVKNPTTMALLRAGSEPWFTEDQLSAPPGAPPLPEAAPVPAPVA